MGAVKRSPLSRKTPLDPGRKPLKRTAFKVRANAPLPLVGRKGRADRASLAKSKPIVQERSGGYCEFRVPGVCQGEAVHIHHRETGHSNHSPDALSDLCAACHAFVHQHPELAYERGWLVAHG